MDLLVPFVNDLVGFHRIIRLLAILCECARGACVCEFVRACVCIHV